MESSRRRFLKLVGISMAGLGALSAFDLFERVELGAQELTTDSKALTGKRWAIAVDVAKLDEETVKKAIDACNREHNIPQYDNSEEEIKWIWHDSFEHVFPGQEYDYLPEEIHEKPFLLLCNHCSNPPCVRVCPTRATWQRPDGVVMMDQHRCIGCRYCMAACPFGARSFNWRDAKATYWKENEPPNPKYPLRGKGVVEKCTFCDERLAEGLPPACVEAVADTKALIFGDLDDPDSEIREVLRTRFAIRRKAELGTSPNIYYLV
ncbi:MAG: 4Fe-4S dicluster domain-containing protein [Deltaproteobacteria bacterium]|nr:4Fe-4S dicluster domain-containing protein [Deltaproteobacteria bacterium]MBW2071026.1 4Fe-4S dicluster domain-containing protein [Deltaproteobacteria bacterium]